MPKIFPLLLVAIISVQAKAGILGQSVFVEPYLGFKTENTKLGALLSPAMDIKTSAPYAGLKLGYRSLSGIDLNLFAELTKGKARIDTLPDQNDFSKNSAGVQLGINSLGHIKMYLGTSFVNEFKVEDSSQTQSYALSGPSYHAGILVKLVPYLNLGVQYYVNQYNKVTGAGYNNGEDLDTYYSKVDTQEYSLYLSSTF
ncbi:MAG: hypothetical protein K0R29_2620 [Pseudobdellovibrio sp.]|jgi:hypothetical protein|nr:hypothetical protein [Pseudobdellovibrio sp.]